MLVTRRLVALLFITIMQQIPSPPAKFFQKIKRRDPGSNYYTVLRSKKEVVLGEGSYTYIF